jgi:hypothetical protein
MRCNNTQTQEHKKYICCYIGSFVTSKQVKRCRGYSAFVESNNLDRTNFHGYKIRASSRLNELTNCLTPWRKVLLLLLHDSSVSIATRLRTV